MILKLNSLDKDKEVASFMRRKNKRGEDRITAVVRIKGSPRYSATFRSLKVA